MLVLLCGTLLLFRTTDVLSFSVDTKSVDPLFKMVILKAARSWSAIKRSDGSL